MVDTWLVKKDKYQDKTMGELSTDATNETQRNSELGTINHFSEKLKRFNDGRECLILPVSVGKARAFRIIFQPALAVSLFKAIFSTDWDDTLEGYTNRKDKYYKALLAFFPQIDSPEAETKLRFAFEAINRATRVLPVTQEHPERYSSLFEMAAESRLLTQLDHQDESAMQLIGNMETTNDSQARERNEKAVRQFLNTQVINSAPELKIMAVAGADKGPGKTYFQETVHQSSDILFEDKPPAIAQPIWDAYIKAMTASNITAAEISNFDLGNDVYWIIATAGLVGFQTRKVINGLETLKAEGRRMPNEIVVFTRGRKETIFGHLFGQKGIECPLPANCPFVPLDDSRNQLDKFSRSLVNLGCQAILLWAFRAGSKRAGGPSENGFNKVDMEKTPLSVILAKALGVKT
jgi:hypothetical protein